MEFMQPDAEANTPAFQVVMLVFSSGVVQLVVLHCFGNYAHYILSNP